MISAEKNGNTAQNLRGGFSCGFFPGEPPFKAGKAYVLCGIALKQAMPPVEKIL